MESRHSGATAELLGGRNSTFPASRQRGELVAGKYLLERPLAQGGMGSLWVASHVELDVEIAVKFSTMERSEAHDVRFRREARATARLRSPHVVHVFDYGVDRDEPYIAMELLEGESLRAVLEREGRLSLARTAALVAQVAKGLELAHEAGIVHRDLKPSNLFLARAGNDEVLKILDFGIAKASAEIGGDTSSRASNLGGEATRVGTVVGSPGYMSPEQARGELVDSRSDLWSLAVVTFRMLTGSEPFIGSDQTDTMAKICEAPVPRACQALPELPPDVDGFFRRALARPKNERFQSAAELSSALSAIAERHPEPSVERTAIAAPPKDAAGRTAETSALPVHAELGRAEPRPSARRSRLRSPPYGRTDRRVVLGLVAVGFGATLVVYLFSVSRGSPETEAPPSDERPAAAAASNVLEVVVSRGADTASVPEQAVSATVPAPSSGGSRRFSSGRPPLSDRGAARLESAAPATAKSGASPPDEPEQVDPVFGLRP